ncbi:transferrin-binding protein-like solute binding protein [Psychrobacter glaciei]|uniref:transferrin-binding protein-like solute binding protein n=1 Tax=Psychrobacter glaciei TaxID=619771 RepID=UPI001F05A7F7|nr:transferrin-binding protein-like solute binding protein [Psychrobacter glaciei]MCH1781900.1 transferrin-binding protein-like solute binding protein [Psychrobacter glaciei]
MPLDRHSILAVSTAKKLNTPLKASVVLLTAVILASCSTSGGDNSIAPKPTPVLPGVEDGETGGGETGGGETGGGETGDDTAAIKAAEARAKDAEAKAVIAENQTKIAQTKLAEATKALDTAKKDAQEKIDALENASKSEINAAKKAAQTAQDALKTAEEAFKVESSKAVAAAKAEAAEAEIAAEAARAEAVAKIEAAAKASKSQVDLAKKAAAEAVEKVKVAEDKAKEAEVRAKTAIEAAEARVKAAEAIAKTEAEKAKQEANARVTAEAKAKAAEEAKTEAEKATVAAETARAKAEAAKLEAEKALEEVLANGGGSEALQKEAERKAKLAEQAQAQAQEAQAVAQAAQQAAAAQVAAAQQAQQAAEAALAAAAIKNAPEATKSGVQSLNIDPSAAGLPNAFTATSRDFNTTANSVEARADTASGGLLPIVNITTSGTNDTNLQNGFKSHDDSTDITTALGVLPLTYTSTYKDFGDDMRIGHIDGAAALGANKLPVNGVAVVGNATQAANMPTEGKVGYTGDATYRQLGIGNDIEFGKSVFTADFVAQNVKGDLTFDKAGKIGLTAGINGNQFSGTAADNAGYNTEGGFFGGDAQYLGGVYEGKGAQGTYGAKSDKQTAAEKAADKAQADVKTAQAATAAAQAQAAAAQSAAEKAKADATKAQEALVAAEEALANAGNGENQLAAALERAAAAEAAEEAALEAAETAKNARAAAETAKIAAETAAKAAKDAADKAVGEAKVEADKKVAAANQQVADAKVRADKAEIDANTAKAAEAKAKTEAAEAKAKADIAVKAANAKTDLANQQAADAQAQAQTEKQKAAAAQAEADKAKGELVTAQADLAAAEKALADALASGGGNTEALQAEVDRRQAALDAANAKIIATEQAQAQAAAAAAAQVAAAQSAQQAAEDALAAAKIKNAPEAEKSGAQSINVGTSVAGLPDFVVTTRDFEIGENNVIARADVASGDLLPKVDVNISGEGDTELANGFKSHDDNTSITTALGELPLEYTSVYKDYGNDMRVGHIDGAANLQGTDIPVNGVAVVGNATQAANMPTEGKVGYTGDATYRQLGLGNDIEFGKSVFTADFVAQNVKGDLTFDKAGKIGLTAGINGNQFSGTAADNAGYNTEGGFFGGDAQYLGGVYEGKGAQGTYGAKSDKQTAAEKAADKAQADVKTAQAATAAAQAQAAAAQSAAEKAKADATKAQEALVAAEEALANAGNGENQLAAALERAAAAEAAEEAALEAAETAKNARAAAETAKIAAETAAKAAKDAADKAVGEAKVEADKKVAAANQQVADAKVRADKAEIDANTAKAAEAKAKTEAAEAKAKADIAVKAANAKTDLANQQAADAQAQAQTEKQKAAAAQAEADKAKGELVTAQADLAAAEKALADALASGGGNTEALQAEVDRRQAALDAANAKIIATEQAQAQAAAAAAAQVAAAQSAQQAAEDALAAAKIKNAPEAEKSGAQSINVGTSVAGLPDFVVTTRDFEIGENNVIARADVASGDLLPKVDVNISGEGDTELANGFKSHDDNTSITTALGELPLEYTSVYKDYGNDMRVGHIDGAANLQGTDIPVNGVAVVGNATQAANMPTEGKVGYTGDATYRQLGLGNDIEFGKSVFTADFVAQNVKGDLTFDKAGKIGLTAGINGNQFSGTAADNAGYNTEGGFFGGDAQYLGGVYEGKGAQGTYGAKSDKQTAAEKAADKAQADADKAQAAIANANAQAANAQAAADKAKADATKAQEALAAAEEALANAGTGDGGLAAALARAEAAEAAEGAALEAASKADAARIAAQTAQMAAEQAQISAEKVAEKAVGDAQAQKEAKEKALQAQAVAESAKAVAEAAKIEAENAKTEALNAKVSAEAARDEAIARAEAAEAEALEAANKFTAPDSRVSGFQSTSVGSDDGIFDNNSNSYNQLKVYANEVDGRASLKPIDVKLRGANDGAADNTYGTGNNGFKEHKGSTSFEGRLGGTIHKRDMNYSSVYKNFDNQMQIGHLEGDIKNGILYKSHLSNTYVQGNATNLGDMDKLANVNEGKANYEGVATYAEGGKIAVDGTSKFDVDFVAKSVKGELDFADKQVDINATISNNTFASEQGAAVNTVGGFYGKGASLLGGVYERETKDNYIKGTYGASKIDPTVEIVPDPTESKMTGFQSTALSSKEKTLPLGQGQLDNAIGYVEIRDDKSAWTELKIENGSEVPVDNRKGDNFTSFSKGKVLADMVKPDTVLEPITVNLTAANGEQKVEAGRGSLNPTYQYNAVYKNFDSQMQVGHVYGNLNSIAGDVSRAANVYVEGYLTSQAGMESLKNVNAGKAQYQGMATYIENIHLADNASTAPVNGTSAFNVDFVNGSVDGTLSFTGTGYKYMPAGNEIKIDADITGNTFAGNKNGIDTAGGFYGKEAQFLGGIYQDASVPGGSGDVAGTGTKFQGTFGAEKQ